MMKFTITIDADTHESASQVEQLFSALAAVSAPYHKVTPDDPWCGDDPVTEPGPSDNIGTITVHSMTGAAPAAPLETYGESPVATANREFDDLARQTRDLINVDINEQPAAEQPDVTNHDCDINGLPWDARIHASTKTKIDDGSWRARRGVAKEVIAQIEAELKSGAAPTTAAPVPFVVPADTPIPTPAVSGGIIPVDAAPVAAPTDATTAVEAIFPTAPVTAPTMSYADFMQNLSVVVQTKGLNTDHIKAMCAAIGVADVMSLGTSPELIPAAVAYLDTIKVK